MAISGKKATKTFLVSHYIEHKRQKRIVVSKVNNTQIGKKIISVITPLYKILK